jgi:hypothetical protein
MVGTVVCNLPGVNGATIRKARERITLTQLLEQDRRHPWEVVLNATHTMDAIVRDLQVQVLAGKTVTADQLDRLINVNQIRHHLATAAITTKAHQHVALAFEQHLEMQGRLVGAAIGPAIDKLALTEPWRFYALEWRTGRCSAWATLADEPRPPSEPIVQEYDVRPRPALEAGSIAQPQPCDVPTLDDDALRDLGERVPDEANRSGIR